MSKVQHQQPLFKIEYYSEMCRYLSILSNKSLFPKNFQRSSKYEWIDYEISVLIMKNIRMVYQDINLSQNNVALLDFLQYSFTSKFEILFNLFYLRVPFIKQSEDDLEQNINLFEVIFIIISLGYEYALKTLEPSNQVLNEFAEVICELIKVNILTVENTRDKQLPLALREEIYCIIIFTMSTCFTFYSSNK